MGLNPEGVKPRTNLGEEYPMDGLFSFPLSFFLSLECMPFGALHTLLRFFKPCPCCLINFGFFDFNTFLVRRSSFILSHHIYSILEYSPISLRYSCCSFYICSSLPCLFYIRRFYT